MEKTAAMIASQGRFGAAALSPLIPKSLGSFATRCCSCLQHLMKDEVGRCDLGAGVEGAKQTREFMRSTVEAPRKRRIDSFQRLW
jgi:hypothetical protein